MNDTENHVPLMVNSQLKQSESSVSNAIFEARIPVGSPSKASEIIKSKILEYQQSEQLNNFTKGLASVDHQAASMSPEVLAKIYEKHERQQTIK